MARSLNSCSFIGNLGKDIESRAMPNGKMVANFSIGVGESYTDKSGNKVDKTEWVRCTAYDKLAEICIQYLSKGSKVFVQGRMETRSYEKDGATVYTTGIVLDQMQMLGGGESRAPQKGGTNYPEPIPSDNFDDQDIPF
jgi:single-strand DNA-binding protein